MGSIISISLAPHLVGLFTSDAEVIKIGVEYLRIVGFFYITFTTMFVIGSVMRGAGDTIVPMIITFVALWVVRVPLCYYLSQKMGYVGIWYGIPIAWIFGMTFIYLYYLTC